MQRAEHIAPCETAIRLEERVGNIESDVSNHFVWRKEMAAKIDNLKEGIHRMELRLYLVLGGIGAIAWAYEHWFGVGKP